MKRIKDVNGAVKEYTHKTLTLKQIEPLEAIRDKLWSKKIEWQNRTYEQFIFDEHKEIDAANPQSTI